MRSSSIYFKLLMLVIVFFVLGVSYQLLLKYRLDMREKIENRTEQIFKAFYTLKNIELGFFHEKDPRYLQRLEKFNIDHKETIEQTFENRFMEVDISYPISEIATVKVYQNLLIKYHTILSQILEDSIVLGLTHNQGLYGSLRSHAHALEDVAIAQKNDEMMLELLKMRRHEKDYMLRGLPEYREKFNRTSERLRVMIVRHDANQSEVLQESLEKYIESFNAFVKLYDKVGHSNHFGMRSETKEIREKLQMMDKNNSKLYEAVYTPLNDRLNIVGVMNFMIFMVILLLLYLMRRELYDAQERSPLTGLNGNRRIKDHLKLIAKHKNRRVVVYFDFDYFKAFNDHFGFKKGDEVIDGFARILKEEMKSKGGFLGHIGGDDFIMIAENVKIESYIEVVENIQERLSEYGRSFYTPSEVERGYIIQTDRYDTQRHIPLLQVSAAVVFLEKDFEVSSIDDLSMHINKLKRQSKQDGIATMVLTHHAELNYGDLTKNV